MSGAARCQQLIIVEDLGTSCDLEGASLKHLLKVDIQSDLFIWVSLEMEGKGSDRPLERSLNNHTGMSSG